MSDGRNHAIFAVNGKVHNLRISFNALAEYNKIGSLQDFKDKSLPACRGLVWAGINAYGNESVTIDQAGDLCEDYILEKGMMAFASEIERILAAGVWLKDKGGTDTGNQNTVLKKVSENISESVSPSPMGSAVSPLPNSGT